MLILKYTDRSTNTRLGAKSEDELVFMSFLYRLHAVFICLVPNADKRIIILGESVTTHGRQDSTMGYASFYHGGTNGMFFRRIHYPRLEILPLFHGLDPCSILYPSSIVFGHAHMKIIPSSVKQRGSRKEY